MGISVRAGIQLGLLLGGSWDGLVWIFYDFLGEIEITILALADTRKIGLWCPL